MDVDTLKDNCDRIQKQRPDIFVLTGDIFDDLQMSGHTHAGQIWPTGQLGEIIGVTEKNYGMERIGDFHIIVSSGIAGRGYGIRTGGHSEFVIADVEAA